MSLVRPLDRYVFTEWFKIFLATALGFPLLVILFDATDNLDKYLAKKLPPGDIAMSYVYGLPDSVFMILPAAVLFATVLVCPRRERRLLENKRSVVSGIKRRNGCFVQGVDFLFPPSPPLFFFTTPDTGACGRSSPLC